MCASSSSISHNNSSRNKTLHKQTKMAGFILIFSAVATAYLNQADLPMTSCAPILRMRSITRPQQHLVSGSISGVPSNFFLLVDYFGIEYVGKEHALHLRKTLEQNYEITTDWEGTKFAGIDLAWDYNYRHANRTCRISVDGYIAKVLLKYGHPSPKKPQLSPHKHREVIYVTKEQLTPEDDTTPPLDSQGKKRVQGIVGALLYYAQSVDNKLLVGLSSIGLNQAAATQRTNDDINKILDCYATYSAYGIIYCSSDMFLCAHSDTGFHNKSNGRSRAGAHIFLSENDAMPRWNESVITLAKIIKFVVSSASEAEIGAIFITAQEIVAMRQTLEEIK